MLVHIEITRVDGTLVDSRSLSAAGTTNFANLKAGDGLEVTLTTDTDCFFAIGTGTPSAAADPRQRLPPTYPRKLPFAPNEQVTIAATA